MKVKILTCKICGEEIESRSLWKAAIDVHIWKHFPKFGIRKAASKWRKKYFTEKTVKVPDKITEAPHFGTTTDS
jgi:hypothetical protein